MVNVGNGSESIAPCASTSSTNNMPGGGSQAATTSASTSSAATVPSGHRRGHRRQESFYEMTGLYSEACADDSSTDIPVDSETGLPQSSLPLGGAAQLHNNTNDIVIKCHSRQASSGLVDRDRERQISSSHHDVVDDLSRDCGILSFRPLKIQKLARIKVRRLL